MHIFGVAASFFRPSDDRKAGKEFLDGLFDRKSADNSIFYQLGKNTRRGRKTEILRLVKQRLSEDKEYFIALADATGGYHPIIVFAALRLCFSLPPDLDTAVYFADLQLGLKRLSQEDKENCLRIAKGFPARKEDFASVTRLARIMSGKE